MKKAILLLMILATANCIYAQEKNFKKIEILESNNRPLNSKYERLPIPESISDKEYAELKEYVLANAEFENADEPALFFDLMRWVGSQWAHDGWNAAPDTLTSLGILKNAKNNGTQYRCVEYGKVLHDVLLSFGYVSRTVGLKSADVAYGGVGMGHVAAEVWSNKLNKWIFLDPQFIVYAEYRNVPLNVYEIYSLKKNGKFDEIAFIHPDTSKGTRDDDYAEFLKNYLGYMDIAQEYKGVKYGLVLKMEGKKDFITFQAFPSGKNVFTDDARDLYFDLNRATIIIDFTAEEYNRTRSVFGKLNIKTAEEFDKNMPLFAAKPDLELTLLNNMPWFEKYSVFLNNVPVTKNGDDYKISLDEGINVLTVVPINAAGIEGAPTEIKIKYEY